MIHSINFSDILTKNYSDMFFSAICQNYRIKLFLALMKWTVMFTKRWH